MLTKYLSFWGSPDALYILGMVLKIIAIIVAIFIFIFGWREAVLRKREHQATQKKAEHQQWRIDRRIDRIKYGAGGALGFDIEDDDRDA